jgi:penicillin-binding protein 2
VALLKDPEIRARIETPLPLPEVPDAVDAEGAAPDQPTVALAAEATPRT